MGVVNVTPDSFSDGGEFLDARAASAHARRLAREGADILDIGGESTRPGAEPVGAEEELRRVLPVLEEIGAWRTPAPQVSVDTSKASVARAAIAAGATLVNDVSALRADPEMVAVVAESEVDCCLMHMLGEPRTMQRQGRGGPRYTDVVDEVKAFLEERLAFAVNAGVREQRVMLDPGIGFGKTVAHNLALLRRLGELTQLGRPLLVGTSRKSFLGRILAVSSPEGDAAGAPEPVEPPEPAGTPEPPEPVEPAKRLPGTIATNVLALERGASVFRVHDVAPVRAALAVAAATLGARWTPTAQTTPTS